MTESNATPPPPEPVNYASPASASSAEIETNPQARTFGMLCHLGALAGYLIPFGHIIGPLVFWLIKKDQYPFVDDQGKESLNFQITVTIAAVISAALICVVVGIFMLIAVGLVALIFIIIAAVSFFARTLEQCG